MGFALSMKLQPTVGVIAKDSNAAKSELKVNDRILAVNSQPIKSFEDLRIFLQDYQGSDINFKVQRDEQIMYFNVPLSTRKNAEGNEEKYIGIIPGLKRSFFASLLKGTYETYNLSIKTLTFVGKMITRDLGTQNLSGPIGIVQMAGDTAKAGFMPFLYLMALLSISLGVLESPSNTSLRWGSIGDAWNRSSAWITNARKNGKFFLHVRLDCSRPSYDLCCI